MGPNFRYCARGYCDCADHTLALMSPSPSNLYAVGFDVTEGDREVPAVFIPSVTGSWRYHG